METFKEAFELLKLSWVRMLKLYLISFGITILGLIVLGALFVIFFVTTGMGVATGNAAMLTASMPLMLIGGLALILFVLAMVVVSLAVSAGMMMVAYDTNMGGREAFRRGVRMAVPLLGVSILTLLLVLGGYVFLVIPGLLFMFLLMFSNYEVVLNNKGVVESMKRSIYVVKKNWQEVLVKVFLFFLLAIVVHGIVPSILSSGGMMGNVFYGLYSLIASSVFSWYSICYFVILYKSLKDKTPGLTGKGLWLMGVMAIFGWMLLILMMGLLANVLPEIMEKTKQPSGYETPAAMETDWETDYLEY